jgi:hypothetical protein
MQELGRRLHKPEVVLNKSILDECTLAGMHQVSKLGAQFIGQDFGDKLPHNMDE